MQIDPLAVVSVVVPATVALSFGTGILAGRGLGKVRGLRRAYDLMSRTESIRNARALVLQEIQKEGGDL